MAADWPPLAGIEVPSEERREDRRGGRRDGRRASSREPRIIGKYEYVPPDKSVSGWTLAQSVQLLMKALRIEQFRAQCFAEHVQSFAVQREGEDATGARTKRWTRRLCRGLAQHTALKSMLFSGPAHEVIPKTILELEKRSSRHGRRVDEIERQHMAMRDGEEDDKASYSDASAYMGQEWWVRATQEKAVLWIDEYFLLSPDQARRGHPPWAFQTGGLPDGWRKYNTGGRTMYWNPETHRMQMQGPPADASKRPPPPPPREPPVSLLDVGSCTNPFLRFPYLVEPVALDLRPSDGAEGVIQADFFEVPILEPEEGERPRGKEGVIMSKDGRIEGIVAGSFDVVVLSLVLSYVPDARKRAEMVARARRCLRDDRGLLIVVEVGSVLASSSWYQGDAASDWSHAIETAGFYTKRFEEDVKESGRKHIALQWVFETAPLRDEPLEPLLGPRDLQW